MLTLRPFTSEEVRAMALLGITEAAIQDQLNKYLEALLRPILLNGKLKACKGNTLIEIEDKLKVAVVVSK